MATTGSNAFYTDPATSPRVRSTIREYLGFHDETAGGDLDARQAHYERMVTDFYDVVTDFYEYGWGDSFHFAPCHRHESFRASLARHQHYLALRLGLEPGMRVLDVGCGVGGPMRGIARFSGATIEGINNSAYQVDKGNRYNVAAGLAERCSLREGDFMAMPFAAGRYGAAYAIEATCHAPDKTACFSEVFRVLQPGGRFAGYEWCLTDLYDADDPGHRAIKRGIETGNGLPDLARTSDVDRALAAAGFEVCDSKDVALTADPETPWHLPLKGEPWSLAALRRSPLGRWLTHATVSTLETLRAAPSGSSEVSAMLMGAADVLVRGGDTGIFTPSYFFLARKPS